LFRWYVVSTYSGHEDKVSRNLEHRRTSMGAEHAIRRIVVPKEDVIETKDGQKVAKPRTKLPGYVLVEMDALPETVTLVRGTPGVTGFVGATPGAGGTLHPVPLTDLERDRLLESKVAEQKPKTKADFTLGQLVKVTSGPLSDFDGEIIEINPEAGKLKVHVSIFERQVPVELNFSDVKKLD
jgi:transcription termination/antitermination protein NusG